MTETKAPASKRHRIDDETPVPTLLETKVDSDPCCRRVFCVAVHLLPVDVLAKALSFLSVLEIAPKVHKIGGADFPEAMKRATRQITTLKFDREWNNVLGDATARGSYATHLKYKYLRSNIKRIIVRDCPNALHEKFMRRVVDTFSKTDSVIVERYDSGDESRAALRHLVQLPRLRNLAVGWENQATPADRILLESIQSPDLRGLTMGLFPNQLLGIRSDVLRGIESLNCYVQEMEPLVLLLEKIERLQFFFCTPPRGLGLSSLWSIIVKKCPLLRLLNVNVYASTPLPIASVRELFGLKQLTDLRLGELLQPLAHENWTGWWNEAAAAWPSLNSIVTSIPMPKELLSVTMDVWPALKMPGSYTPVTLNADVVRAWSLKHPLCRVTDMNAIWMIGSDRINAEALAERLKG